MEQPEHFAVENKVCLLSRAICGLKQAARVWNVKIDSVLKGLGFVPSKYDSCIYSKIFDKNVTYVALYVDDFFVFFKFD